MRKRLLALLLCLCMAATFLPGTAWAVDTEQSNPCTSLTINGVTLNADNPYYKNGDTSDHHTGSGSDWNAKFEPAAEGAAASTLTLKGLSVTDGSILFPNDGDLNLVLTGESTVEGQFTTQGNLTLSGEGSLTVTTNSQAIVLCGDLILQNGTFVAKSKSPSECSRDSVGINAKKITVNGGELIGEASSKGIVANNGLTVTGGKVSGKSLSENKNDRVYGVFVGLPSGSPYADVEISSSGSVTCYNALDSESGLIAQNVVVRSGGQLDCAKGGVVAMGNLAVDNGGVTSETGGITVHQNLTVSNKGSVTASAQICVYENLSVSSGGIVHAEWTSGFPAYVDGAISVKNNLTLDGADSKIEGIGGADGIENPISGVEVGKVCTVKDGLLKGTGIYGGIRAGSNLLIEGGEVVGICTNNSSKADTAIGGVYYNSSCTMSGGKMTAKSSSFYRAIGLYPYDVNNGPKITSEMCSYTTTEGGTLMQGEYALYPYDRYVQIDCTSKGAPRPKVTSITITPPDGGIVYRGYDQQFTATVVGEAAAGDKVNWSVVKNGELLYEVKDGLLHIYESSSGTSLTIRATHDIDREKYAEITVTVKDPTPTVEKVTVTPAAATIEKGGWAAFTAEVEGQFLDAEHKKIVWSVTDEAGESSGISGITLKNENNAPTCTLEVSETYDGPESLIVKATSQENHEKSATAQVTVSEATSTGLTRAEAAKIVYDIMKPSVAFDSITLPSDCSALDTDTQNAIKAMKAMQWMSFTDESGFNPSTLVTRDQAASLVVRVRNIPRKEDVDISGIFTDVNGNMMPDIAGLYASGVISATADKKFNPGNVATGTDLRAWLTAKRTDLPEVSNISYNYSTGALTWTGKNIPETNPDQYFFVQTFDAEGEVVDGSNRECMETTGDPLHIKVTKSGDTYSCTYKPVTLADGNYKIVIECRVPGGSTVSYSFTLPQSTTPDPDPTPSTPGSGGGSYTPPSSTTTETTKNPDGSTTTRTENKTTGTVTETTKNPDGSQTRVETKKDGTVTTTETDKAGNKSETVEKPDGSSVTKVNLKDGTTATANTDTEGRVEAEVKLPEKTVAAAQEGGSAIALPIPEVKATKSTENAPAVTVKTGSKDPVKVEIPASGVTPGTVAVIVKEDGSEEIIKTSVATENGLVVALPDGATVKIVDNAKQFSDVPNSHWGAGAADFVSSRELFSGTSETTFSPETTMTRGMLMTVLAHLDGADTSGGETWYEKGMDWAVDKGVSDGSDPDGSITREQMVAMIWRYAGSPAASSGSIDGFADAGSVSSYTADAMRWAVESGLIAGSDNNTLLPQGVVTRVQVAQLLKNFIEMQ